MSTVKVLAVIMLVLLPMSTWPAEKPVNRTSKSSVDQYTRSSGETDPNPGQPPYYPQNRELLPLATELAGDEAQTQSRGSVGSGAASSTASPGFVVDRSWEDWQYTVKGRRVDFRGNNDIHFGYDNAQSPADVRRMGYNVYDPTAFPGNAWPQGPEVGCEVQSSGEPGAYPTVDVKSSGLVVLCGFDDAGGQHDNHLFYQYTQYSCFWGPGTYIPPASYQPLMIDPTSTLLWPIVEIQEDGGTTYTHVLGFEEKVSGSPNQKVVVYAHKTGTDATGTWTNVIIIDTIHYQGGHLTASRVSSKVAATYTKITPDGIANNQPFDNDVWYRESADNGINWDPRVNITNYPRYEASHSAWIETHGLYDTDDNLHIIWNASPTPAWPYDNINQNWGTFDASLFHWRYLYSNPTDSATSLIHNAEWGVKMPTLCSFGGFNVMNVGNFSIAECGGRMYVVWSMWNDYFANPPKVDDCASGGWSGIHGANADLFMSVSYNLEGNLWDEYRDITHSYAENCDSAGFGGICDNDTKSVLSRYGMDLQLGSLQWSDVDAVQSDFWDPDDWANPGASPIPGDWYNDNILQLFYLDDHFPSTGWYGQGLVTENELRWIRLACVDPVAAPIIRVDTTEIAYPSWTPHGIEKVVPVTVTNEGNVELNVYQIDYTETSGPGGWLGVSTGSFVGIPPGESNTAMFDIYLNQGGTVNNPGQTVSLEGYVDLLSDAVNTPSLTIPIDFLVVDSLMGVVWDTVSTVDPWFAKGPNEFVGLIVNNMGSFGHNSLGGVNMDYTLMGGDCDPLADVYLCDGSVFLMQDHGGGDFSLTTSMHANDFVTETTWKPLVDDVEGGANTDYDSIYTGRFANWDSSVVAERTYYAPRNFDENPTFVITKTMMYSPSGIPQNGLTIGSMIDWDIPADEDFDNDAAVSVPSAVVYLQGTDTLKIPDPDCQENANRFAAEAFLGWQTTTDLNSDPCANNESLYGMWATSFHEWYNTALNDSMYSDIWDSLSTKPGLNANGEIDDQAVFSTYLHDYTLAGHDTLYFYTVLTTVRNGTVENLETNIQDAEDWYYEYIQPECPGGCFATGDVNGDGWIDVNDMTELIDFLILSHTPPSGQLYEADLVGDCVIDSADLVALECFLFIGIDCVPVYPMPTCCSGHDVWTPGDTTLDLGDAQITTEGDTLFRVDDIGTSGQDGARMYFADVTSEGISMDLTNADLSANGKGISFRFNGLVQDTGSPKDDPTMQMVGGVGLATTGGAVQIMADFTAIGCDSIAVQVWQGPTLVGQDTLMETGLVAIVGDYGFGLPTVSAIDMFSSSPPAFRVLMTNLAWFHLVSGDSLAGSEIRIMATKANKDVLDVYSVDVQGTLLGWFSLSDIKDDYCCRGFTGNTDNDPYDFIDISDLTVMIDFLFISYQPPECIMEGQTDGIEIVDNGDLTRLIDFLFISYGPPEPCPDEYPGP